MRKIIYLILSLVLFIQGCAWIGQTIGYDLEKNLFPEMIKLHIVLNYFDKENKRWPNDYNELTEFANKNKMDLQFNSLKNIEIKPLEDGSIAIYYDYTMFSDMKDSAGFQPMRHRAVLKRRSLQDSNIKINNLGDYENVQSTGK